MDRRLRDLLSASARAHSSRTAVIEPGGATIRYRNLDEQSSRIAELLERHGVPPGNRVAVHAPKSIGAVPAIFGILKAGAADVPVDPAAPARRKLQEAPDRTSSGPLSRSLVPGVREPDRAQRAWLQHVPGL